MQRNHIFVLVILILVAGVTFVWGIQHWYVSSKSPSQFEDIKAHVSSIPTPKGWYAWYEGVMEVKHANNLPQGADVLFGNSEFNKNSFDNDPNYPRAPAVSIDVYGESLSGETPEQWINYNQTYGGYNGDPSLRIATSSDNTSSTENGRLIIESIETTMGGNRILSDYLFDGAVVYDFSLSSVSAIPDMANSSDAQILRGMVKQFAESLPSIIKQ